MFNLYCDKCGKSFDEYDIEVNVDDSIKRKYFKSYCLQCDNKPKQTEKVYCVNIEADTHNKYYGTQYFQMFMKMDELFVYGKTPPEAAKIKFDKEKNIANTVKSSLTVGQ